MLYSISEFDILSLQTVFFGEEQTAAENTFAFTGYRKIQVQETVKVGEIDEEKWTKSKDRLIVFDKRLQEHVRDAVSCRFCQGDVNIMEQRAMVKWTWFIVDHTMPKLKLPIPKLSHSYRYIES